MKLGSLKSADSLDGELIVVSRDLKRFLKVSAELPDLKIGSLREAVEKWNKSESSLQQLSKRLNQDVKLGKPVVEAELHSCLPRTFLFADGSAFIHHIKLVRKARKAELPATLQTVPLMYQGESGKFLAPNENIPQVDFAHGTDFEAEIGVITDFVPMGTKPEQALNYVRLVCVINDVSLRGLIPAELGQGFGFFQSKPASALSPFAVTPDELGEAYVKGRVCLPLRINLNDKPFGHPNAQEMHFHFGDLIAHAARTRDLAAGSLIGSGTVSNEDSAQGSGCLAEIRTLEQIQNGEAKTPFMSVGDKVSIWMENKTGENLFGTIAQKVSKAL